MTTTLTFNDCVALGIKDIGAEVTKTAESAAKEYTIEETLSKMLKEWETTEMELTAYKNTGTFIMKVSDEIMQMLDDHIVLTQQISFSPFKGPFEKDIDDWQEKLRLTSEVIEEWIEVQKWNVKNALKFVFKVGNLQTMDVFGADFYKRGYYKAIAGGEQKV